MSLFLNPCMGQVKTLQVHRSYDLEGKRQHFVWPQGQGHIIEYFLVNASPILLDVATSKFEGANLTWCRGYRLFIILLSHLFLYQTASVNIALHLKKSNALFKSAYANGFAPNTIHRHNILSKMVLCCRWLHNATAKVNGTQLSHT